MVSSILVSTNALLNDVPIPVAQNPRTNMPRVGTNAHWYTDRMSIPVYTDFLAQWIDDYNMAYNIGGACIHNHNKPYADVCTLWHGLDNPSRNNDSYSSDL